MEDLIAIIIFAAIMLVSFAASAIGAINKAVKASKGGKQPGSLADFLRDLVQPGIEVHTASGTTQRETSSAIRNKPGTINKQSLIEDTYHAREDANNRRADGNAQPPALPVTATREHRPAGVSAPAGSEFARKLVRSRRFAIISHEILGPPKGLGD